MLVLKCRCSERNHLRNRNMSLYPTSTSPPGIYAINLLEGLAHDCTKLVGKKEFIWFLTLFFWSHSCKHWTHQLYWGTCYPLNWRRQALESHILFSYIVSSWDKFTYESICDAIYRQTKNDLCKTTVTVTECTLQARTASVLQPQSGCSFKYCLFPTPFLS